VSINEKKKKGLTERGNPLEPMGKEWKSSGNLKVLINDSFLSLRPPYGEQLLLMFYK
jgi:hypothetical protein